MHEGFNYGDWVQSRLNSTVMGIIIGGDTKGIIYQVQLSPTHVVVPMHRAILELVEDDDEYEPEPGSEDSAEITDNVVYPHFGGSKMTRGAV